MAASFTSLIPAWYGIRRWQQLTPAIRYIAWFVIVPGAVLGIGAEVGRWVFRYNLVILSAVTLCETVLLAGAYARALHSPRIRWWFKRAVGLFLLVACVETGLSVHFSRPINNYSHFLQTFICIGLAFAYFEQLLRELPNIHLERDPMFLVSVGVCLYYTGSITIFMLEPYMQKQHTTLQLWIMFIIQSALYMLLNGFIMLALHYEGHVAQRQRLL
ncbi:hypothetical protein EI291_11175 [Hymenobacter rigui]|uniref:Uncharacterized protein n=1 Tax=Hymenobacter rigui TaxID=334424 RepID=A0A428KPC7_9BACT|nr:hypothetical protein EI291_11175 [Hymenobacter rigui]